MCQQCISPLLCCQRLGTTLGLVAVIVVGVQKAIVNFVTEDGSWAYWNCQEGGENCGSPSSQKSCPVLGLAMIVGESGNNARFRTRRHTRPSRSEAV